MARIAHASLAALGCALFAGCASGDATSDEPAQAAEAGAGSGSEAGSSGGPGHVSTGGSGGHAAGRAAMAAAEGGGDSAAGKSGGSKASAGAGGGPNAGAPSAGSGGQGAATADVSRAMIAADPAPTVADADYAAFIEHLNQLGLDLGQKQAASNQLTDKNGVYSPLSASYALAMTYAGARRQTEEEMKKVLGDSFAAGVFHKGANRLARELASRAHSRTASGVTFRVQLNLADALLQKAFIAVDEAGTEAAAATAVGVSATSLPAEVIPFTVDRPFLFFIRDQYGVVLFSGQLVDPSQVAP